MISDVKNKISVWRGCAVIIPIAALSPNTRSIKIFPMEINHRSFAKLPLTSILPFDVICPSKFFRQQLQGYSFLIKILLQAIEHLEKKEMHHFDALVGENACQMRALKLCLITSSCIDSFSMLLPNLIVLKNKIDGLLESPATPYNGILQDFLLQHNAIVELSRDELFIVDCYLLTLSKKSFPMESLTRLFETIDSSAFKRFEPTISGQFAKNLINKTRIRLALSSVEFIRNEAQEISGIVSTMVSPPFTILHNRLECISCFWSIYIIMKRSAHLKIPIILIAHQEATDLEYKILNTVALVFQSDGKQYCIADPEGEDPDQLGIVIEGSTCRNFAELRDRETWVKELLQHQPQDLFLANGAMHRQYPDASKDHLITEEKDPIFLAYCEKSLRLGCCLENPSLFFVFHVYCQTVGNCLEINDQNLSVQHARE